MEDPQRRPPDEDEAAHNRLGHRRTDEDAPYDERGSQGPEPEEQIEESGED